MDATLARSRAEADSDGGSATVVPEKATPESEEPWWKCHVMLYKVALNRGAYVFGAVDAGVY